MSLKDNLAASIATLTEQSNAASGELQSLQADADTLENKIRAKKDVAYKLACDLHSAKKAYDEIVAREEPPAEPVNEVTGSN